MISYILEYSWYESIFNGSTMYVKFQISMVESEILNNGNNYELT
jgi:hypothetical protein